MPRDGQALYLPFGLVALAGLRARQGDDALADRLYDEAIGGSFNPWLSANAMVGQAAVARRLGDLTRSRALLAAADSHYREAGLPDGQPDVLAGLAWWALAAGHPDDATVFAADAAQAASGCGAPFQFAVPPVRNSLTPPKPPPLAGTRRRYWSPIPPSQQSRQSLTPRFATSTRSSRSPNYARPVRPTGLSPTNQTSPRSPPASRGRPQHHLSATSGHPSNLAIMQRAPASPAATMIRRPITGQRSRTTAVR